MEPFTCWLNCSASPCVGSQQQIRSATTSALGRYTQRSIISGSPFAAAAPAV